MALNLVRNSKVFFTTNVNPNTGVINSTGFTPTNTYEIQVLDGLSLSQNTANETISVSEAGGDPVRGTRAFNTTLEPASFSFSTYIRPESFGYTSNLFTPGSEEAPLWNAFLGADDLWARTISNNAYTDTTTALSGISTATYAPSTGQITITGTSMGTTNLVPGMIVYMRNPFTALTPASPDTTTAYSAAQLAGLSGEVRVVSKTAQTGLVVEYLVKPAGITVAPTTLTIGTSATFVMPNTKVITGSSPSWAYTETSNTLAITGSSLNTADFPLNSYWVIQGITGTDAVKLNNQPAKVTATSDTRIAFTFANAAVHSAAIANAAMTTTNAIFVKSSWIPVTGRNTTSGTDLAVNSFATMMNSNKNQLLKCGFLFLIDQVTYALDNAVLTEASIDFGIDAVATIAWSGQSTAIREFSSNLGTTTISDRVGTFTGRAVGESTDYTANAQLYKPKNTVAEFLSNKLSTCDLTTVRALVNSSGVQQAAANTAFTVALTGGNITISNNVTYLTPAVLGVVNQPINYFTGNRSITGTLNAYLKTGTSTETGELLKDMLGAASTTVEPYFKIEIAINGKNQNNRMVIDIPNGTIGVPTIDVQQVVSTTITFAGQGTTGPTTSTSNYDIEGINDVFLRYYAA